METLIVIIILIGVVRAMFGGGGDTAPVIVSQSAPLVGARFVRTEEVSVNDPSYLSSAISRARIGWNRHSYFTSEPHVSPDGLSAFFSVYDRD
jgi:hypothetical protein